MGVASSGCQILEIVSIKSSSEGLNSIFCKQPLGRKICCRIPNKIKYAVFAYLILNHYFGRYGGAGKATFAD
jgi:hypothetical protein